MKKEILIAIVVGLVIGLIITFGMYRARTAVSENPEATFEVVATPVIVTPTPQNLIQKSTVLTIQEPDDETLIRTPDVRVTGKTTANTPIVILYNEKELVTRTDAQGNFSITVTVTQGATVMHIRAMIPGGVPADVIRTVVYTTNDFFDAPGSSPSAVPAKR